MQDVVEVHLLGDISAKRENFFEAAGVLAELRSCLARAFDTVALLREKVCASPPPPLFSARVRVRPNRSARQDALSAFVDVHVAICAQKGVPTHCQGEVERIYFL